MGKAPKSFLFFLAIVLSIVAALLLLFGNPFELMMPSPFSVVPDVIKEKPANEEASKPDSVTSAMPGFVNGAGFMAPLSRAAERVTKKPFGVHITKAASPVRPERFSGYHTGTDFEVFPDETDTDVGVSAICDGALLMKRSVSGYGGVAVQSCAYDGQPITVVYGHLRLSSIRVKVGEPIIAGDFLGNLGAGYSSETDGERKHLHLGIHRGDVVDIRGYVAIARQLSDWIDPYVLIRSQQ
ncbi:MAG TPA: M23 family metallopeptidase [Candidatus Fimivivens sp.]|nr:M23 family metallopeptidase [Candidatus Fimivivens sp.]